MKYILAIVFLLGYIFFAIAIFTSGYSTSKDFVLLGILTAIYCPIAIGILTIQSFFDDYD